jgi:hypothetical protein
MLQEVAEKSPSEVAAHPLGIRVRCCYTLVLLQLAKLEALLCPLALDLVARAATL